MAIPALATVKTWAPFKIDALGLITLLGADTTRKILGQLVYSPWEYFPLLAGHIVAYNSSQKQSLASQSTALSIVSWQRTSTPASPDGYYLKI
jgi:hypothetical protein